jgi:MoxR-like ATPase
MPSDLSGVSIYERQKESFVFHPGPVFAWCCWPTRSTAPAPRPEACCYGRKNRSRLGETRPLPVPFFCHRDISPQDQLFHTRPSRNWTGSIT